MSIKELLIEYVLGMKYDVVKIALKKNEVPLRDDSKETSLKELDWCIEEV